MIAEDKATINELIGNDYSWRVIGHEYLKTSPSFVIKAVVMSATMLLRPKIMGALGNDYLAVNSELQNYELLTFKLCFGIQAPVLQLIALVNEAKPALDKSEVGVIYRSGLCQSMLLAPLAVGLCLTIPFFMQLTLQPEVVLEPSKHYFLLSSIAFVLDLFVNLLNRALLGLNEVMSANVTDCLGNVIYLLSSYGLVLGKAGLPKLEVTGLALALIITKVAMLIIKTSYVFMQRLTQQYQFYQGSPCIDCSYLKKMFIKGIQIGVQGVFDSVSPTVMTTLLGTKGTRGLIAMQASSPFSMMIMIPNFYL